MARDREAEKAAAHARAVEEINTAVEAAEQVEATPQALMASHRDLRAIGVGHGDWSSLVQRIGGYGPSLQEAIVRLGALMARTLAALATQSCRAVESLLRARGGRHTRDSPEVSLLREVIELLRAQESAGKLRGLAADGMIDRVRSRPIRSLQHSPHDPDTHTDRKAPCTLSPSLRTGPVQRLGRHRHGASAGGALSARRGSPVDERPRVHRLLCGDCDVGARARCRHRRGSRGGRAGGGHPCGADGSAARPPGDRRWPWRLPYARTEHRRLRAVSAGGHRTPRRLHLAHARRARHAVVQGRRVIAECSRQPAHARQPRGQHAPRGGRAAAAAGERWEAARARRRRPDRSGPSSPDALAAALMRTHSEARAHTPTRAPDTHTDRKAPLALSPHHRASPHARESS